MPITTTRSRRERERPRDRRPERLLVPESGPPAVGTSAAVGPSLSTGTPPSGNAVEKGPFCLWSDGSITDRDSRLRLPPHAQVGGIHLDRFALKSDPTGRYVITDPEGRATSHRFRGGRWEQATPGKKS